MKKHLEHIDRISGNKWINLKKLIYKHLIILIRIQKFYNQQTVDNYAQIHQVNWEHIKTNFPTVIV